MSKQKTEDWPTLAVYLPQLEKGVINEIPLNTEISKPSRYEETYEQKDPIEANKARITKVLESLTELCISTLKNLENRIVCPPLIQLIQKTFDSWDLESLKSIIEISRSSGRSYGQKEVLIEQFFILKKRFLEKNWPQDFKNVDKWLYACHNSSFYLGCEDILHFALCCLVKSPCESIVESVGSVINRHGCEERSKLSHENLNDEVFVSWNGPEEFSCAAQTLIRKALHSYFPQKIHLYTAGTFSNPSAYTSSTIVNLINKPSRVSIED